jgi:hypothetical protein
MNAFIRARLVMTVLFLCSVSTGLVVAQESAPWCNTLAFDGGGYWTIRVPVVLENLSSQSMQGTPVRVVISQSDGTSMLIGEKVAGLRAADAAGVELLFGLETAAGQRKRDGILEAGDILTVPVEADVDSTGLVFLYAGNNDALCPPDARDFADETYRPTRVFNDWLDTSRESVPPNPRVRIEVRAAERQQLTVERGDVSWIQDADWTYRVPLRVRNFSDRAEHSGSFTVNTRAVNNRIGKLLGFTAVPHPGRIFDLGGDLRESLRSTVTIAPLSERTLWLYISPNADAENRSPWVEHESRLRSGHKLDVRAGAIEARRGQRWPLEAWVVDPLVKVFRQDLIPASAVRNVEVFTSRNASKSFQIAVRSMKARDIHVRLTALKNPQGQELPSPRIYKTGYVPVEFPVRYDYSRTTVAYQRLRPTSPGTDGWAGWWPDPLIPMEANGSCHLVANTTQPIWFDLQVPANSAPGCYRGYVEIDSDLGTDYLPVSVQVWKLVLPDARNTAALYDLRNGPVHSAFFDPLPDEEAWYRFLAQYNISPGAISSRLKFTRENGQVRMGNVERFDEMAGFLIDELHCTKFYSPVFFKAASWYGGARPIFDLQPYTPEYQKAWKEAYRLFVDHITEKGWRKYFVTYLADEPRVPAAYEGIRRVADMAKEVAPDIPTYVSAWHYVDEIADHITMWGIGAQGQFPTDLVEERRKAGDRFIYTTDGQQCMDTPFPATERLMPWFCFKYGAEAFEFWGASWWTYNPWKYGWHTYFTEPGRDGQRVYARYPNGDGYLAYPGQEIGSTDLVPSIRIIAVREGIDDYEIFHALNSYAEAGNSEAKQALDRVRALIVAPHRAGVMSTSIIRDPAAIVETRIAAGEVLDRLTN